MSNTLDKTQSQYERKLARQRQLDMMEAAASGQAYDPPAGGPTPSSDSSTISAGPGGGGGVVMPPGSTSIRAGGAGAVGAPPEGAIESARRFLWDEDEEENYGKTPSYDSQQVQFLSAGGAETSSRGGIMNRMFGAMRFGRSTPSSAPKKRETAQKASVNLAPRRNSLWMSDAAPRSQDMEEFNVQEEKKPNPILLICYGIGDCFVAIFHTLVGACAILAEIFTGCIASCKPKLVLTILGILFGMGMFVFALVAIINRTSGGSEPPPTPIAPPNADEAADQVRFGALRSAILESTFTIGSHLDTPGTAQNLALRWLTDDDPAKLEVDDDAILQRYALAVFYFSTYVASEYEDSQGGVSQGTWKFTDYWMSEKGICLWYGVSCPTHLHEGVEEAHYNENSDVIKLNLTDNNIRGTIPPEMAALENLATLDLGKNKLDGSIPSSLSRLKMLTELYLEENELVGNVPTQFGQMTLLRDLFIGTNKLEGTIPGQLGLLTNLRALGLDENFFTGTIPDLFSLTHLLVLYLDSNELTGTISYRISAFQEMMDFRLRKNRLTGEIPETIHDMKHLELFYLDDNDLTGSIPSVWDLLPRVQEIQVYKNRLNGPVPDSIHELRDLKVFYADNNELSGTIPASFGSMGDLHTLYLFNNNLVSTIPSELGNMEDLRDFQVYNNVLTGSIPTELGRCFRLEKLELQDNKLVGPVPSELGQLQSLSMLKVFRNQLTGVMPAEVCDAKQQYSLGFLAADCNTNQGGQLECPCCNACYP